MKWLVWKFWDSVEDIKEDIQWYKDNESEIEYDTFKTSKLITSYEELLLYLEEENEDSVFYEEIDWNIFIYDLENQKVINPYELIKGVLRWAIK